MQESSDGVNYSVSDQGRHFIWLLFHYCPRFLRKASWTILTSGPLPPCHGEGDAGEGENAEKHAAFKCKSGVKGSGRDLLRQKSLRFGVAMAGRRPSSPETRCHALSRRGDRRRCWARRRARRISGKESYLYPPVRSLTQDCVHALRLQLSISLLVELWNTSCIFHHFKFQYRFNEKNKKSSCSQDLCS